MTQRPVITSHRDWQDLIGIQFALGGSNPATGLNCYGLVREVYRGLQIELPKRQENALDAELAVSAAGNDWTAIDEPLPMAVALIRSEGTASTFHLGIVTPEYTLLHSLPKKGVVVSQIAEYQPRIVGFYVYTPGHGERLPLADGTAGRILGTIALVALTIYTGGATSEALVGYGYGATAAQIGGALAAAAFMMAGTMVLNAIAPIKPEGNSLSGYTGDLADSRSYTWDGIQNDARQGLAKAMIFGRIKCGGQIISEKTWFHGTSEYLDMLICPCIGMVTRFDGIQINDTDISLYRNTGPVFRPGDDQQTPIDMFNRIYLQYSSAAKIPYDASTAAPVDAVTFSTKAASSGIRLTVTAPNGIYQLVDNRPAQNNVTFRVQYRETGTGAWSALPSVDPIFDIYHPMIHRSSGVFSGSANPFTLTDSGAEFTSRISPLEEFVLQVDGVPNYCIQTGTITAGSIQFNAFTDAGHTSPLGSAPANGEYYITDSGVSPLTGIIDIPQEWIIDVGLGTGGEGE